MKLLNLVGQKIGSLEVVKLHPEIKKGNKQYHCVCECGNKTVVTSGNLVRPGGTKSCGCSRKRVNHTWSIKHGMHNSKIYSSWEGIKARCYNVNNKRYKHYGGRGIKVCDAWMEFQGFWDWANDNGYRYELTIERIDVNGNYEPSNCQWIPKLQQYENLQRTIHVKIIDGKTICLKSMCRLLGVKYNIVYPRIKQGLCVTCALFVPWIKTQEERKKVLYFIKNSKPDSISNQLIGTK